MIANSPVIDERKYAKLLARSLPTVIETEQEYERRLAQVEPLFDKGDDRLTPEEAELLKLLSYLIEEYEEKHFQLNAATPRSILQELMDARGLGQSDLARILGSRSRASEILNGKRAISLEQAKLLARYFNVSVELFI